MARSIEPIEKLVKLIAKMFGVGSRVALKYAYRIVNCSQEQVEAFSTEIVEAKKQIKFCKVCGNFTFEEVCDICKTRDSSTICVVKEPKDVVAIEKGLVYSGTYHILHGVISPLKGIGPDELNIAKLLERVSGGKIKEIIVATNPDVEGEATALYLARLFKPFGVIVSRIAHGVPVGSEIEFIDENTLSLAIKNRKEMP